MTSVMTPPTMQQPGPSFATGPQGVIPAGMMNAGAVQQAPQMQGALSPLLDEYLKGSEEALLAYTKAHTKAVIERAKPDNERRTAKAEKAEAEALALLTEELKGKTTREKDPDKIMANRAAVLKALQQDNPETHAYVMEVIKIELSKQATGFISHSPTSLVTAIHAAKSPENADKMSKKLKRMLDEHDLTEHLSEADQDALFNALVNNAPAVKAENAKANPVATAVGAQVDGVVAGAKSIPGDLIASSVPFAGPVIRNKLGL